MANLTTINAVWIGSRIGPIHGACLRSFLRHGHRTILHVYERPLDVPKGVEISDANELLPEASIVRYSRGGSPAIFADFLRYEILRKGLGLYVDCDVFCLSPIEDREHMFGWEGELVNNAVLKLPSDSPVLSSLCRLKDAHNFVPPWASAKRKAYYKWRSKLFLPVRMQDFPWGYTGPFALSWYLSENGLTNLAYPIDYFYPVHPRQTNMFLDPGLSIADLCTHRTQLIHLYHENLKHVDVSKVPASSPLGLMLAA